MIYTKIVTPFVPDNTECMCSVWVELSIIMGFDLRFMTRVCCFTFKTNNLQLFENLGTSKYIQCITFHVSFKTT